MAITVTVFRAEIMLEMGESTADTDLTSLYLAWIQEGVDVIFNYADWGDFLYNTEDLVTVASTAEYSLQASAEMIESVRNKTTNEALTFYSKPELESMGVNIEQTGTPTCFYDAGYDGSTEKYKIGLWPIPDAIYTLVVAQRRKSILLATSDNMPLPRAFFPALKNFIRRKAYLNDGDYASSDRAASDFINELQILKRKPRNPSNNSRLAVSDLPKADTKWVRFNPAHFRNKW